MRMIAASIVVGPLMLMGALPAVSQSILAPVRLAASDNSAEGRDSYAQKARDDMQAWQRKLHDAGNDAAAQSKAIGSATDRELNAAWTKAEAASRQLQIAGADGWASVKAYYENASRELADDWDKSRSQVK